MFMFAASIAKAGVFALPLGNAKTALVDARDVGAVAAAILQKNGHASKTYQLTGPDLITFYEVADRMAARLDTPVKYIDQTPEEFRAILKKYIHSEWQLDAVCGLFGEIAKGSLEEKASTVRDILGRDPISVDIFSDDFASVFSRT